MTAIVSVGLGGALGAILRYLLSTVPVRGSFPFMTFLTNLLGAVLIGFVVGLVSQREGVPAQVTLFLKTGLCGGFTTFSTFSLETLNLLEGHRYGLGVCYAAGSLLCCLAGVAAGRLLAERILP